ncbi:MAG: hypothetical protein HY894_06570 [Deltaproteobacteria bacterium]|nr:hypothetical protein [Deltaproteobacteria bacterium]
MRISLSMKALLIAAFLCLLPLRAIAEPMPDARTEDAPNNKRVRLETELDAYYTNAGLYVSLTDEPIPDAGEKPEFEVYRSLLYSSLVPRFLVLEAGVFPMPNLGVYLNDNARNFYDGGDVTKDVNIIKAVTAGFEEPYALSLFLGDVVSFTRPGEPHKSGNFGYMGYLVSVSNYHIRDNTLVPDKSVELEWKIKGDRKLPTHDLHWSFRVGGKLHGNPDIRDVVYLSLRRSRLDFEDATDSVINNSGFEYTVDFDRKTLEAVRHYLVVDKKWPFKEEKMGFSIALGFIWQGASRYAGDLALKEKQNEFQVVLRPNIEF